MSNSFPKQNLPLRVVLNLVGEATLNRYGAIQRVFDSPDAAFRFWNEAVAGAPCHEPEKEHLVAMFLSTKLRLIGYHVVVGTPESGRQPYFSFREAGVL